MKYGLFATALLVLSLGIAPAMATTTAYPDQSPTSQTPEANSPQQVACQPLKFTRPDAAQNIRFMIGVYGGNVQEIKACNTSAEVVQRTPNSVGIVVTYGHGNAVINLPTSMKDGTLNTFRCVNDDTGGSVANVTVYRADWSDGLPDHVAMHALDPALYNRNALLAKCQKLSAGNKHY